MTTIATSVLDDPVFDEFGGWWLVPASTLVVRGTLVGTGDGFRVGDRTKDIWLLDVDQVLLGEEDAKRLKVATFAAAEVESGRFEHQRQLHLGEEGIFFLVPYFGPDALEDVYALNLGSIGVINTDLDHWSEHLPSAADTLASISFGYPRAPDTLATALLTEWIVEGTVASISAPRDTLGWSYVEAELKETEVLWPERSDLSEGGFQFPSEFTFTADAARASLLLVESEVIRVRLRQVALPDPLGARWLAFGGPSFLMDRGLPPKTIIDEMDSLVRQRDDHITSARQTAVQVLRRVVQEAGRMPLSSDPPPESEAVDLDQLYRSPLVIHQESTIVTFDRWFMTLMDGEATVMVTDRDGSTLTFGPVEGKDSIMRELADHSFEFVNDRGVVVARVSQEELSAALAAAYDRAANP